MTAPADLLPTAPSWSTLARSARGHVAFSTRFGTAPARCHVSNTPTDVEPMEERPMPSLPQTPLTRRPGTPTRSADSGKVRPTAGAVERS
jgi:hypothetical protein